MALITDFGYLDSYIAELKLAVLEHCPDAKIIDFSHNITAHSISSASYYVQRAVRILPTGAIIMAIVDPGVGSERQAVIIQTQGKILVGPDNGIFARGIDWKDNFEVRVLSSKDVGRECLPATFHGRDLFAPIAGKLANGMNFNKIGKPGLLKNTSAPPSPIKFGKKWYGEIIHIDHFGNLITDLPGDLNGDIVVANYGRISRADFYEASDGKKPVWLKSSDDNIEIAFYKKRADIILGLKVGDKIYFIEK